MYAVTASKGFKFDIFGLFSGLVSDLSNYILYFHFCLQGYLGKENSL